MYESAFHPDSGEKQNLFGRMSFQVPGGMLITGAMLQFYRTVPAIVFWQWVNQSFNALVNYTNRNANSPLTVTQLGVSYVSATSSALAVAIGFKGFLQKHASPFAQVINVLLNLCKYFKARPIIIFHLLFISISIAVCPV